VFDLLTASKGADAEHVKLRLEADGSLTSAAAGTRGSVDTMDRLVSLFSLYDFLGYVLCGAGVLVGSYWAFSELPLEPGTAAMFGVIALSYAVGHAVQSLATVWEDTYWKHWGMPSTNRMVPGKDGAYDDALRSLILARVEQITGRRDLQINDAFAVARAELRARQADGRAELMNTMYGLCRGLMTTAAVLVPTFVTAGLVTDDWKRLLIGAALMLVLGVLYLRRTTRYSYRFADQVWRDFGALPEHPRITPSD